MNYLQLVNDFMIETDMDDQIVTVTGQIDDGLKATIWIRDAWLQSSNFQFSCNIFG